MAKMLNSGVHYLLEKLLNPQQALRPVFKVGLYLDDPEPAADVIGLTLPDSDYGYAAIALADADWSFDLTNKIITNVEKTFTAAGGAWGSVYGYFIMAVLPAEGEMPETAVLIAVQHFADGPYVVPEGGKILITPQFTGYNS